MPRSVGPGHCLGCPLPQDTGPAWLASPSEFPYPPQMSLPGGHSRLPSFQRQVLLLGSPWALVHTFQSVYEVVSLDLSFFPGMTGSLETGPVLAALAEPYGDTQRQVLGWGGGFVSRHLSQVSTAVSGSPFPAEFRFAWAPRERLHTMRRWEVRSRCIF